jgi:hypothetical protein
MFLNDSELVTIKFSGMDQVKLWNAHLLSHKQIRSYLVHQIHSTLLYFLRIHLLLVMVWLEVDMVLLVQDMVLLALHR